MPIGTEVKRAVSAGWWMAAAALLVGCAKNPSEGHASKVTQPLGTTLTLTAPNPLSPIAPVLEGSNSANVDPGANVVLGTVVAMGNGGFDADANALLNDVWSRGTAQVDFGVQVRGVLHASNVIRGPNVVINGTDTTPALDPPSTLSWNVNFPSGTGSNVNLLPGQSQTLTPGLFRNVVVGTRATLTLSTGTYYFSSLQMLLQSTVNLDQAGGPVIIYVASGPLALVMQGSFVPLSGTDPDLFIGYLGQLPVLVASLFDGAIFCPSASLSLAQIIDPKTLQTQTHTGFFAAQSVELEQGAQVQYRVPAALVAAAAPQGGVCNQLLSGLVPPDQLRKYCTICVSPDDSDRDGVPDCLDACPYDPLKWISPGVCGCGTSDIDSDNDGDFDCIDQCPNDPNNIFPGQCGCVGQPGLQPAGTPCSDTACPQSGATCDGNGVCGNRAACSPASGCKLFATNGVSYWLCGVTFPAPGLAPDGGPLPDAGTSTGQLPWSGADAACTAKGETLNRITTLQENRFIAAFLAAPIWLGANDLTTSGQWRWAAPGTNNGDLFWSGGPTGAPVNNLFSFWGSGAPASQRCAAMEPGAGQWFDVNCNESLGYVCEYRTVPVFVPAKNPAGGTGQPPPDPRPCVPSTSPAAMLPTSFDDIVAARDAASQDVFIGPAANPPGPDAHCPSDNDYDAANIGLEPDAGGGCAVVATAPNTTNCIQDSDCPAGFLCRQKKDEQGCTPPDSGVGAGSSTACKGHSLCVKLSCPPDSNSRCDQIEICDPGTTIEAGLDPSSNLTPQPFNPASLFGGSPPDAAPTQAYLDPPDTGGSNPENHSWCFLGPQNNNSVTPANEFGNGNSGHTNSNSIIHFDFTPNLTFNINPSPLALGENNLTLKASASLDASVSLHGFLNQSYTASIVSAAANLNASRCGVDDNGTQLVVFGLDKFKPSDLGIPDIDTARDFPNVTSTCFDAVSNFQLFADRTKKAFRDAQQLLSQYHAVVADGGSLAGNLCEQLGVAAANVPFFPGGNTCGANEPVEITINRFIDYYQAPGSGQLTQLKNIETGLQQASKSINDSLKANYDLNFLDINKEESITILDVTFPIGPIPLELQIDVFADYGINGNFGIELKFPDFKLDADPSSGAPSELAHVTANVMPYASAGLSAFVGVGFSLGPIGAAVGIEGDVTLAEVQIPIFAGAGVDLAVTADNRLVPPGIGPPVSVFANNILGSQLEFGLPKSFKFFAWYNYGLGVDLQNILSGELDGTLRIDFFFFSRTWRQRIVKFNGFSEHINLVSGGSDPSVTMNTPTIAPPHGQMASEAGTTQTASGDIAMGLSEQQVPLTQLAYLSIPADPGPSVPFDKSQVVGMFYDNLCCAKLTEHCTPPNGAAPPPPPCCPGLVCNLPEAGTFGFATCGPGCGAEGQSCQASTDCCSPFVCGSLKRCQKCALENQPCASQADCCGNLTCDLVAQQCTTGALP
jgi:hypothetical protein